MVCGERGRIYRQKRSAEPGLTTSQPHVPTIGKTPARALARLRLYVAFSSPRVLLSMRRTSQGVAAHSTRYRAEIGLTSGQVIRGLLAAYPSI